MASHQQRANRAPQQAIEGRRRTSRRRLIADLTRAFEAVADESGQVSIRDAVHVTLSKWDERYNAGFQALSYRRDRQSVVPRGSTPDDRA